MAVESSFVRQETTSSLEPFARNHRHHGPLGQTAQKDLTGLATISDIDAVSDDCGSVLEGAPCEACPYCADTCGNTNCDVCLDKVSSMEDDYQYSWYHSQPTCPKVGVVGGPQQEEPVYTICQVRRHCTKESLWIVAGKDIYDVTPYVNQHPGGTQSILRKAGGVVDCTEDLKFHSKTGQKAWKKYKVGTLVPCRGHEPNNGKPWWQFWT